MERIPVGQLKDMAGYELPELVFDIEQNVVSKFAAAVEDDSPRWRQEALPSLVPALGFDRIYEMLASSEEVAVLHGATDVEFYRPVQVGDTIEMKAKIASARERRSANGIMIFVNFDIDYLNQEGEKVVFCRQTALVTHNG